MKHKSTGEENQPIDQQNIAKDHDKKTEDVEIMEIESNEKVVTPLSKSMEVLQTKLNTISELSTESDNISIEKIAGGK